jgi:hypothetical protein
MVWFLCSEHYDKMQALFTYSASEKILHKGKCCITSVSVLILYITVILVAQVCGKRLLVFDQNYVSCLTLWHAEH